VIFDLVDFIVELLGDVVLMLFGVDSDD